MFSLSLVAEPPRPSFSPEQVSRFFFSPQLDENGESTSRFLCKVCKNIYKQAEGREYSNLMQHLDDDLSARTHRAAIEAVLGFFGKTLAQVAFLVGDNCSVNKKLARLMDVPLNLAVKPLTSAFDTELDKTQQLMVWLRTIKQSAKLRFATDLRPTHLSSTFSMLARYFKLLPHIDRVNDAIADLLPTAAEAKKLKTYKKSGVSFEEDSVDGHFDVGAAIWFYFLLFFFMHHNAAILADKDFEAAVVKMQRGQNTQLTRSERQAVRGLREDCQPSLNEDDSGLGFAERVLKRAWVDNQDEHYLLANAVAPTSSLAERLFSVARATVGLDRHGLQPITLESILFLRLDRSYWNVQLVYEMLESSM
ncbi:hypothetical protein P3T76_003070 [Phytophthora citrophthora]|uniref:BED-type domain-containing protein n=1 Tax=Phytophthora citrophthora TaxID=4793 RepID=A0AAD9GWF0_9STRA|nr:hypothetical protein P3T76_003070 [Phytophthora citrophthora]